MRFKFNIPLFIATGVVIPEFGPEEPRDEEGEEEDYHIYEVDEYEEARKRNDKTLDK